MKKNIMMCIFLLITVIIFAGCDNDSSTTSTNLYSLTVNTQGQGTVDIQPKQDQYDANTTVTLIAKPDSDWDFSSWEGSGYTGNINTNIKLIMDSDKTLNAVFGQVLLKDDFSDNSNNWYSGDTSDSEFYFTEDGKYAVTINDQNISWLISIPIDIYPEDYYVEYDFEFDTDNYTEMALPFNYHDIDNYYKFRISIYGNYNINKKENGEWSKLVDWTGSDYIKEGTVNKIAIKKFDNKYYFYANGKYLDSITVDSDAVTPEMRIGVGNSDDFPATIKYDNFKYLNLSPGNETTAAFSKEVKLDFDISE